MRKGLFITFEGKDGSGKSTHSESLMQRLVEKGYKVKHVHFPRYKGSIGGLIGKILSGEIEMPKSFKSFQMLYIADQLDWQEELKSYLDEGYIVIADRYDLSTIAYYTSKMNLPILLGYKEIKNMQKDFIEPDITFIFDYTGNINERRKDMDKECDAIENDKQIDNKIRNVYKELVYFLRDFKELSKEMREVHLVNADFDIDKNKTVIDNIVNYKLREMEMVR